MINKSDLDQFTGTETWFRHLTGILFTEGAKYLANKAGAYWLLDEIAFTNKTDAKVRAEEFQVWTLTKIPEGGARLTCGDGNHNIVFRKHITFTDFPLDEITLWLTCNVILLPSEY